MVRASAFIFLHAIPTLLAGSLNCAAYIAGIIEGALSAAEFQSTVIVLLRMTRTYCTAQTKPARFLFRSRRTACQSPAASIKLYS
jgi:hypothetical protein